MKHTFRITYSQLLKIIKEELEVDDKADDDIVGTFEDKKHYNWFDYRSPGLSNMPHSFIEQGLKIGLSLIKKMGGYDFKRIVVRDKDDIVAFLIYSEKSSSYDDLGDKKSYPVIISTAVSPEYRNKGLLKKMIDASKITKPFLVQIGEITPPGLWEKFGCKYAKSIFGGNKILKCD